MTVLCHDRIFFRSKFSVAARFEEYEYIFRIARDRIIKVFPPTWINILTNKSDQINANMKEFELLDHNNTYIDTKSIGSYSMRLILQRHTLIEYNNQDIMNTFRIRENVNWNIMSYCPARDTYHRSINYKMLTNSYVTRKRLFRMRIIESPDCIFCGEDEDDLIHAVYECPVSKLTWENVQAVLRQVGVDTELDKRTVICGIGKGYRSRSVLNAALINIKNRLASPNSTERHFSVEMVKNILKEQYLIEQAADTIRGRKGAKALVNTRWSGLAGLLDIR